VSAHSFDYAVVRIVPRVERGEFVNAGAIVFCRTRRYLGAEVRLDRARVQALAPTVDLDEVAAALALIPRLCAGDPAAGPIAKLDQPERFHWLVAPRSTILQTSPVHTGLTEDPAASLERLFQTMVA
jgi:Protein of unknown function (DUF3037)